MSQQTTTQWQAFLDTAKAKYATACDVYQTAINSDAATMESLTAAQDAYNAAGAQWTIDQHTANTMAQAELDAATAKGCAEVVEVVSAEVTTAQTAETIAYTLTDAGHLVPTFGIAWGADGQVLTNTETVEAIATGRGWFDRQGRWVNRAGWERKIDAQLASK